MALNIKNDEVERLVAEVARRSGQSKTQAIKEAMKDQLAKLEASESKEAKLARIMHFLETEVWPNVKPEYRGKGMTKAEREEILGYGPDGFCPHN